MNFLNPDLAAQAMSQMKPDAVAKGLYSDDTRTTLGDLRRYFADTNVFDAPSREQLLTIVSQRIMAERGETTFKICPFKKYKGTPWAAIAVGDRGYVEYFMKDPQFCFKNQELAEYLRSLLDANTSQH